MRASESKRERASDLREIEKDGKRLRDTERETHKERYAERDTQDEILTRLRADSRGTPTVRGRQCRMSKKDKRRVRRGSREQKHTEHTNQFE